MEEGFQSTSVIADGRIIAGVVEVVGIDVVSIHVRHC